MSESQAETIQRSVDADHPWLGLSPFTSATKEYFFGRDQEIRDLFLRVREQPLTILYGQSGLGKTSLLGAGLIPKLQVEGFVPRTIRLSYGPNDPPLVQQVLSSVGASASKTLWEAYHYLPTLPEDLASQPPVLIFDQFEEIFTLAESTSRQREVHELFTQLADLIENRPPKTVQEQLLQNRRLALQYDLGASPVRIVLALREDYLSHLENWKKAMPSLMRNRVGIYQLSGPQALEAVVRPGRREGRDLVSDDVGANIVRFVAKRDPDTPLSDIAAVPPILSLLCDELNQSRLASHQAQITAELVSAQSADILQNFYNRAFDGLPAQVRRFVEDRMVTVGGHRNPVAREDVLSELSSGGVPNPQAALDQLIVGRLLSSEERGGIQRVEITHDVLAPLVVHSRDDRRSRERVEQAEREREEARKQRQRLQRIAGTMIGLALLAITAAAVAITATFKAWDQEKLATQQTNIANEQKKEAEKQTVLAKNAKQDTEKLLAKQVEQTKEASKVVFEFGLAEYKAGRLHSGTEKLHQAWSVRSEDDPLKTPYAKVLADRLTRGGRSYVSLPHSEIVTDMALSADGARIVTASKDGFVQLWNTTTGAAIGYAINVGNYLQSKGASNGTDFFSLPSGTYIWSIALSPDGTRIAVASDANGTQVWDANTGAQLLNVDAGHSTETVIFSPDGSRIACDGPGNTVRVWNVATGEPLVEPLSLPGSVKTIAFSPDGTRLAAGGYGNYARLWDVANGAMVGEMQHGDVVWAVSFSPDGKKLATGSADQTARLWDAFTGASIAQTIQHTGKVYELEFNPNGSSLATATDAGTVHLWDAATGASIGNTMTHGSVIASIAYSPDGSRLATGSYDKSARVWDASNGSPITEPLRHDDVVDPVIFSPDGTRLATASWDQTARMWDVMLGSAQGELIQHTDVDTANFSSDGYRLTTLALGEHSQRDSKLWKLADDEASEIAAYEDARATSPDGTRYVTAEDDTAILHDANTGDQIGQPMEQEYQIDEVVFSRDGSRLAIVSKLSGDKIRTEESAVRTWDAATGQPLGTPVKHESWINVVFSRDAKHFAAFSSDDIVHIWETSTGSHICDCAGHSDLICAADFNPDGTELLTCSADKTARVWNATTGKLIEPVIKHTDALTSAAFSPDGTHIGTGSANGVTQLWDAMTHEKIGQPIEHNYIMPADILFSPNGNLASFGSDAVFVISEASTAASMGVPLAQADEAGNFAFSPNGDRLAVCFKSEVGILGFASYPADIGKYAKALSAVDDRSTQHDSTFDSWLEDNLKQTTFKNRHSIAVQSYAKGDWFAAAFHLRWLCQQKPENERWRKMLEDAEKNLNEKPAATEPSQSNQ